MTRTLAVILLLGLVGSGIMPALANGPEHLKLYHKQGNYEDVKFDIELAITNRGLVVDHTSHIGNMLERTGKDLGTTQPIYGNAGSMQFCSAVVSRRTAPPSSAGAANRSQTARRSPSSSVTRSPSATRANQSANPWRLRSTATGSCCGEGRKNASRTASRSAGWSPSRHRHAASANSASTSAGIGPLASMCCCTYRVPATDEPNVSASAMA